jgi:hypothetical protein
MRNVRVWTMHHHMYFSLARGYLFGFIAKLVQPKERVSTLDLQEMSVLYNITYTFYGMASSWFHHY